MSHRYLRECKPCGARPAAEHPSNLLWTSGEFCSIHTYLFDRSNAYIFDVAASDAADVAGLGVDIDAGAAGQMLLVKLLIPILSLLLLLYLSFPIPGHNTLMQEIICQSLLIRAVGAFLTSERSIGLVMSRGAGRCPTPLRICS